MPTPTPLDALMAALDDYLETTAGTNPHSITESLMRDKVIATRAVYEYAQTCPPQFGEPDTVTISHDTLGALADLLSQARRMVTPGRRDPITEEIGLLRMTLERLQDVVVPELARGKGESLL
jgi:hypothetical protein